MLLTPDRHADDESDPRQVPLHDVRAALRGGEAAAETPASRPECIRISEIIATTMSTWATARNVTTRSG